MRKLVFILALLAASCTPESVTTNQQSYSSHQSTCGTIVVSGEDQRGDFIIVQMPSHQDRYQVANYLAYQLNTQICNFDGMVKQPM